MAPLNDFFDDEKDNRTEDNNDQPNAYQTEEDDNLEEKDLERSILTGNISDNDRPVREGQPMGGQSFGQNNNTPSGDDKNNPSQNAGYSNGYFSRTEPLEEHTEDENFTAENQDGRPDYDSAQSDTEVSNENPKPEKVERGDGENDRPHTEEGYQEGTADNDGPNIPGPNELPDQQKIGEDSDESTEADHIET